MNLQFYLYYGNFNANFEVPQHSYTCVVRQNTGWTEEEVRDWLSKNGFEEESQLFEG